MQESCSKKGNRSQRVPSKSLQPILRLCFPTLVAQELRRGARSVLRAAPCLDFSSSFHWKRTAAAGVPLLLPPQLHYQQICNSLKYTATEFSSEGRKSNPVCCYLAAACTMDISLTFLQGWLLDHPHHLHGFAQSRLPISCRGRAEHSGEITVIKMVNWWE